MSRGKYSPSLTSMHTGPYTFNCYGEEPVVWAHAAGEAFDEKTMFGDYDCEGFDSYGYSAFDADGNYCFGGGVDRNGLTELQYLSMTDEEFERYM